MASAAVPTAVAAVLVMSTRPTRALFLPAGYSLIPAAAKLRGCGPPPLTRMLHAPHIVCAKGPAMFTIEHDFDATVITLVDEAPPGTRPLNEDVVILGFDDRVVIEQMEPGGDGVSR